MAVVSSPPLLDAVKLQSIVTALRAPGGVPIHDRSGWIHTAPKSFVGSEAVSWLVEKGHAQTREEGIAIGQQLIEDDVIHHSYDPKNFLDANEWYRFRTDDPDLYTGTSALGRVKAGCIRSGPVSMKKGSGWVDRFIVMTSNPTVWYQYESKLASTPQLVIDLSKTTLDVEECEDCKKDWHCFTLYQADRTASTYCTDHSKEQTAWLEALVAAGANLQQEDLHVTAKSVFEFKARRADGTTADLSDYAGKVCLVVNVSSFCGLTPTNYTQLVELHKRHAAEGLVILGFPSNEFGGQEPKSNDEIQKFVAERGVQFPVFAKTTVNGSTAHPIFNFLRNKLTGIFGGYIKWNFTKFLCDRDGIPYKRYAPTTKPLDFEDDIIALLKKPATTPATSSAPAESSSAPAESSSL